MGCVSSASKHVDGNAPMDGEENEKIAKRQRRRLSVAPQHVGDITVAAEEKAAQDRKESIVGGLLPDEEGLSPLELQAKGKMRHALKSKKGVVPYNRNKVNQDRPVLKYAIGDDPSVSLFGVMDGHGEFGHQVAQFVQDKLPHHLSQERDIKKDPDHYITTAVKNLCDELKETNINVAFSGTTCVFGVRVDQKLYVANIGDSRCVLARQLENGDVQAIGLSEDQKPENPKEKARILKEGGRVEPLPGPPGEDCGPPRVWLAEVDVPGLAMSRSIGDEVSQTVGVISVPEIKQHTIEHNDILAVWASDGVWEFISNEQAISVVWKYRHDLQEAANQLVEEAHKQWKKEEEVVDDITCVIVQFNAPKN